MEPKVNYLVVGLFVVILTLILAAGLIWLTAAEHKPHTMYLVYMNEAATGLMPEAPVKFNGVDVGYVKTIELNPDNPQQVILILSIETDTPINQSTTATLMIQGITGVTYVGLTAHARHAPPLVIKPGESYPAIPYTPSLLVQLNSVLRDLGAGMKALRHAFQEVLTPENLSYISQSMQDISQITHSLSKNAQKLDHIFDETTMTLVQIHSLMKTTTQDTMPNLNHSLYQIGNVLNNMEQFSQDLKNNPSVLIRGKATEPLGPGEK